MTTARLSALLLLATASCGTSTPPDLLACHEGDLELSQQLGERWTPGECASDADCVLYLPDVRCPGGGAQYSWCELAVPRDETGALQAALDGALADVCPRIPNECRGGSLCQRVVARCEDARCVAVGATETCLERCMECLTHDACAARCGAHVECVLDAASCDAVEACGSDAG